MIAVNLKPKNQAKKMPLEGLFQEHLVSELVSTVPNGYIMHTKCLILLAGTTRLELATSDVTGRRSNQTELRPRTNLHFAISRQLSALSGRRNRI